MTQKKRGFKVVGEEEPDDERIYRSDSPPPSPNIIISKESLILVPDGEPVLLNGFVDQQSKVDINDNKVRLQKQLLHLLCNLIDS